MFSSPRTFSHAKAVSLIIVCCIVTAGCRNEQPSSEVTGRTEATVVRAIDHIADCDRLASDPFDPQRNAPGVPEAEMIPMRALEACQAALGSGRMQDSAVESRMNFQLARALGAMGRPNDAFLPLTRAAELGSPAAMKALGDAFYYGKGLPDGMADDLEQAVSWYRQAYNGGYNGAGDLLGQAEAELAKSVLDPNKFSRPDFIKALYNRDISNIGAPLSLAYYTQGLVASLDSNEALFIDPSCKILIGRLGSQVLSLSTIAAAFAQFQQKSVNGSPEEDFMGNMLKLFIQEGLKQYWMDQGARDATVLFNKDVYGCDSRVAKTIINNVMVTNTGNAAL